MNVESVDGTGNASLLKRVLDIPWIGSLIVDGLSRIIHINRTLESYLDVESDSIIGEKATKVLGCDEDSWSSVIEEGEGGLILGGKEVDTRSYSYDDGTSRRCIIFDIGGCLDPDEPVADVLWERLGIGCIRWRIGTDDMVVENLQVDHPSQGWIGIDIDTASGLLSITGSDQDVATLDDGVLKEFEALFVQSEEHSLLNWLGMHTGDITSGFDEFFTGSVEGQPTCFEVSLTLDDKGWAKGLIRQVPKGFTDGIKAMRTVSDYNNLMEMIPSALCIIQDENVVYINGRMSSFLQMDREDILGKTFFRLVHPDDRAKVLERYRSRIAGGKPPSEYSIRIDGGGGTKHARINSNIIEWKGSAAALVILDDVSDYICVEERLKEEERLKRSILNSFPNPVILSSPDGELVWSNVSARKKLNIDDHDVECHQLLAPGESFDTKTFWKGVEEEGEKVLDNVLLRDGRHYRVTEQAVFDRGEFSGIVHDMRDITEQLETAKAAMIAQERLATASKALGFSNVVYEYGSAHIVIDNMPREVIIPDEQGRVSIRVLGDVIHNDDIPSVLEILKPETIQTGEMTDLTFRAMFRRGPFRWYRLLVTKLDHGDGPYLSGAVFDVHELRASQVSLESANRKLNLLTEITGHDIRNQLTALSGYGEILLNRLEMDDRAKDREILRKMIVSMENIEEQLEFAHDYQGLGVEKPRWMDVGKKVEQLQENPSFSHIDIKNDAGGVLLFADPLFKKVLYNLFENSIRHGGHVKSIRVHSPCPGTVVVEDDGVGIATSLKKRIFDRDMGVNTGLGMFLAREILSMTGISIHEDGEPGRGARFVLETSLDNFQDLKVRNGLAL